MTLARRFAQVTLLPFAALTAWAIDEVGLIGVFKHQLTHPGGLQVLVDLVIAVVLILGWLIPDAKRQGRNPWPYVIVALIAGSFGPLLYLALGSTTREQT